jgi:hypothetical protein
MPDLSACPCCKSSIRSTSTACPACGAHLAGEPPPLRDFAIGFVLDRTEPLLRAAQIDERRQKSTQEGTVQDLSSSIRARNAVPVEEP